MKIRLNPLLLGTFITGAVVILIAALLWLGSISFHPTGQFIFYLPHSTSGVSEGTAVELAGVRIGEVQSVRVFYNRQQRTSLVAVICRIKRNRLTDFAGHDIQLTDKRTLKKMITQGMFARIQTSGLVGAKFVELGFHADTSPIKLTNLPTLPYPVVPTLPSTMSELRGNVSDILLHLRQINFSNIAQHVNSTLASARQQFNELQSNQLTGHISTAAKSFGDFMKSAALKQALTRLQSAAANFQVLVTNLNAQVQPASTNFVATLTTARQSARDLDNLLTLRNQLGEQTHDLMQQLNQTALSIQRLADFIQRHPNSLITGRAVPKHDAH